MAAPLAFHASTPLGDEGERYDREEEEEGEDGHDGASPLVENGHHSSSSLSAPSPSPLYPSATRSYKEGAEKAYVEKVIEEIGIGKFQWRVFFICGLFFFADIMEVMFLTYLKMAWTNEDVSSWWSAAIGTSVFCGMLFGASLWGFVADKFGRKKGLLCVSLFISTFGLASTFAPNVQLLVACRAMVGFGLGGSHIAVTLLMELVPPAQRNNMLNLFQGFTVLGVWAESGLAWAFMESLGWRYLALFTSVPSFLAVIVIYWLPESPLWLVVAHQPTKAAVLLQRMANMNRKNINLDDDMLTGMSGMASVKHGHGAGDYRQLFSPYLWKSTILIWIIWFGNSMVYYGLMLLTPEYLQESGTGNVYRDMFISTLAELPALLTASFLIRRVGAPTSQAIFFIGSATLSILIGTTRDVEGKAIAIIISTLIRLFTSGSFYTTYTLTPSIYPTNIRSIGFGAGSSMSRVGGMVTPFIANLGSTSMFIPSITYATTCTIASISGLLLNWTTRAGPKKGSEIVPLISKGK